MIRSLSIAVLTAALAAGLATADGVTPLGSLHCPAGLDAAKGQRVTAVGVVTGQYSTARSSHFTLQDATGAVTVYGNPRVCAAVGDSLRVTGTISVYNGLVELSGNAEAPLAVDSLGRGRLPAPVALTPAQLVASGQADGCEPNESRRVVLRGVLIRLADGAMPGGAAFKDDTNYRVTSAGADSTTNTAVVRVVDAEGCDPSLGADGHLIPTGPVDLVGTVSQYLRRDETSGGYQLLLGLSADITPAKAK